MTSLTTGERPAETTQAFPFQRLPAELRLNILEEILHGCDSFDREPNDKDNPSPDPVVPPLLHVSQAVRNEAFQVYFASRSWKFHAWMPDSADFINFIDVIAPPKSRRRTQYLAASPKILLRLETLDEARRGRGTFDFFLPGYIFSGQVKLNLVGDEYFDNYVLMDLIRLTVEAQTVVHRIFTWDYCLNGGDSIVAQLNREAQDIAATEQRITFLPVSSWHDCRAKHVRASIALDHAANAHPNEQQLRCAVDLVASKPYGLLWNACVKVRYDFIVYVKHRQERIARGDRSAPEACCYQCQFACEYSKLNDRDVVNIELLSHGQPLLEDVTY